MKAQAVEAQLAETMQELQRLRIQKQELGKLLHQAQLGCVSLTGQVNLIPFPTCQGFQLGM